MLSVLEILQGYNKLIQILTMQYRNSMSQRPQSPSTRGITPNKTLYTTQNTISPNQLSRIVGVQVKQGQKIKGQSRITYLPYEKKVTEYQQRQYVQRVPVKRKIIQYEQRKYIQQIPRQVVKTDYYAVQNITQYYRQVVPEKKIQMVPVQRKIRKVQYIPVQKQVIHYPQGQDIDYAKGQSRVILQRQGVAVQPNAQYRQIDPTLIYKYSNEHKSNPIGYVQDGYQRNLSTAPTFLPPSSFLGQSQPQTYIRQQIPMEQSQVGYYTGSPQFNSANSPRGIQNQIPFQTSQYPNTMSFNNAQGANNQGQQYQPQPQPQSQPQRVSNYETYNFGAFSNQPYLIDNPSTYSTHQEINIYPY